MTPKATVFIVDDDRAARESVCALVEAMGLTTEAFESAEAFLSQFDPQRPGCLVTDLQMPGLHGVELQEQLAQTGAQIPVIVISGYANVPITVRAMRRGAVTLLEKPFHNEELMRAVEEALEIDRQRRQQNLHLHDLRRRLETLTAEEQAIAEQLVAGTPNKVIAKQFDIGLRTVERRRHSIFAKLGVQTVAELAQKVTEARPLR